MGFCTCRIPLANTNTRGREVTPGVISNLWLTRMYKDDGSPNELDLTDDPQTALVAAFSNLDPSARLYPIGRFENVDMPKGDPLSEAFNSGRSVITQESPRTFTGLLVKSAQKMLGILQSFACDEIGFYIVDSCGNVTGLGDDNSAILRPIPVAIGSWYPRWIPATDTTVAKVQLDFQVDLSVNDADLRVVPDSYIRGSDRGGNTPALNYLGLTDIIVTALSASATSLGVTCKTFSGEAVEGILVEGLAVSNFRIITPGGTVVTPSAVTESEPGVYDVTYASQPDGRYKLRITTTYNAGRTAFYALVPFTIGTL